MADENLDLAWGYQLEDYINIGTAVAPKWLKVTELLSWDVSSENTEYTPTWIDRQNQPTFIMGASCSITFEKDTVIGGELEKWIMENRNNTDVSCDICRVYTWDGEDNAKTADKATFLFTPSVLSKSNAGQPVVTGGILNRVSDGWTEGTWNTSEKTFSEVAASEQQ